MEAIRLFCMQKDHVKGPSFKYAKPEAKKPSFMKKCCAWFCDKEHDASPHVYCVKFYLVCLLMACPRHGAWCLGGGGGDRGGSWWQGRQKIHIPGFALDTDFTRYPHSLVEKAVLQLEIRHLWDNAH